jgi:hypothetical protein
MGFGHLDRACSRLSAPQQLRALLPTYVRCHAGRDVPIERKLRSHPWMGTSQGGVFNRSHWEQFVCHRLGAVQRSRETSTSSDSGGVSMTRHNRPRHRIVRQSRLRSRRHNCRLAIGPHERIRCPFGGVGVRVPSRANRIPLFCVDRLVVRLTLKTTFAALGRMGRGRGSVVLCSLPDLGAGNADTGR